MIFSVNWICWNKLDNHNDVLTITTTLPKSLCTVLKIVVFFLVLSPVFAGNHYDAMVAFVCNKGAMHMDPDKGWYSDPNTDCLESKEDILDYCKSVYPSLDITNIVETSEHEVIKGWCPVGRSGCSAPETFKVRPFRFVDWISFIPPKHVILSVESSIIIVTSWDELYHDRRWFNIYISFQRL